jgi:hypothetical protein
MSTDTTQDYLVEKFSDENTGWVRGLQIEKDGKTHKVSLYWDAFDGYDIVWREGTPDWAWEIDLGELDERTM